MHSEASKAICAPSGRIWRFRKLTGSGLGFHALLKKLFESAKLLSLDHYPEV
jgi:hypothetical protein